MNQKHLSMLSKVGVIPPYILTRQFDGYVFLDVNIETSENLAHPLYWRILGESGLVEIELEDITGVLLSIRIVFFKGQLQKCTLPYIPSLPKEVGIPKFAINDWQKRSDIYRTNDYYHDQHSEIEIEFDTTLLRLIFLRDQIYKLVEMPNEVICELNNNNELCSLIFNNLSEYDIQHINEHIDFYKEKKVLR